MPRNLNINTSLALMTKDIDYIKNEVTEIKSRINQDFATKEWVDSEYSPTKKVVNALLIAFGLAIITAFAAFVVKGGLQ